MQRAPDGTAFEVAGPEDGMPVVLVHGLGLNRDCWQWTAPALTDRYRVIRYDLYGHGDSPDPPRVPDLALLARQVCDLVDQCADAPVALVGFSLGGMIVRRFAQDWPGRTRALAILHSPHRRHAEAQAAIRARVVQARDHGPAATVEDALARWFTEAFRADNPALMETVRGWVLANRRDVYHRLYDVLAEGVDEIVAPRPALTCPTLVITGDADHGNGPEMSHAIAAEIPGAQTVILPGLRHMALAEAPERINRPLRRFLDSLEAKVRA